MKNGSKAFERAKQRAENIIRDPEKARKIIDSATSKASAVASSSQFQEIAGKLQALIRMIRAWVNKDYREIPWQTIVLAITAVVYFLTPFDAIFDFIPLLGFADDVAILTAVLSSINHDLEQFMTWEQKAGTEHVETQSVEADFEEVKPD
ncbi:hypothetical protein B9H02_11185 [Prosthecochloris sp. HL-130-GSB]|uniref:DUF1232 domain-containing protein n=2 Tax=Prosthecochloris TaxID=1101 RepID=A0A831WQQ8_PROAE|nr:hypothetical protein B9H02_11185 [Prosthecochloris sp. HL-130-GSB]MBO8093500.1 DUF1232 domain-containing protein [Prosthecochloris sp.]HED30145.1 DUF1232 domain-containing protein [Prosthecochloris aestuarii]